MLIVGLIALASGLIAGVAYYVGFKEGAERGGEHSKTYIRKLEATLDAAGLRLTGELPSLLEPDHRPSWTGETVLDTSRPPQGTLRRWDEPSHRA